jgi:hypothetical protein
MNNRRVKLVALLLMESLGTERLPIAVLNRIEREYNPWTAPLAEHIEPIGTEVDATFHPLLPL